MWAVMADYGIPVGDNPGIPFTSSPGKYDWNANASRTRLRNQLDGVLVGVEISVRRQMLGRRRAGGGHTIRLKGTVDSELSHLR